MTSSVDTSSSARAAGVEDLLSCPMCHGPYDKDQREAKLLPCHHSCCLVCLQQIAKGRQAFKCPTEGCHKKTRVPAEGLGSLQTNMYVTQMQSLITSSHMTADNAVEAKKGSKSKPKQTKPRVSMTNQSQLSPPAVTEVKPRSGSGSRSNASGTCGKHFDQPLLFYCSTCQTTICMNCTVLDHDKNAGHQITDVAAAVKVHHEILRTCTKRLDTGKRNGQEKLDLLRSQASHLEISRATAEHQVKETFAQLLGKLEERRDALLGEIELVATSKKQSLVTQGHNIQVQMERTERARTHVQSAIDDPNIHTAIALTEDLKSMSQIEKMCEETRLATEANFIQFDYSHGLEKFVKAASLLGAITSDKTLPAKLQVEFPKMISSIRCAIKVECQDAHGKGLVNYPLTAHIKDPCHDVIPCKLVHQDQGIYAVQLRPEMPGKHTLQFHFLNKPMWQSEFEFVVGSNNPLLVIEGEGGASIQRPTSVALAPTGEIYVADMGNKRIQVFDKQGKSLSQIKIGGNSAMTYDIAINTVTEELLCTKVLADETGHVGANSVCIFGLSGERKHHFSNNNLCKALFLSVNSKGHIIVTDCINNCLCIFSKEGNLLKKVGQLGDKPGQFNFPTAVCNDTHDNIVVSDTNNHRVQVFSKGGKFLRVFGSEGQGKGQLRSPRGVAVDGQGHILVADRQNRVQVFSGEGKFISCVDSLGDKLNQPYNLVVSTDGHVYVADFGNNAIKMYKYQ